MTPPEGARFVGEFQGFKVYEDDECPPDYIYADDVAIITHVWDDKARMTAADLLESKLAIVLMEEMGL